MAWSHGSEGENRPARNSDLFVKHLYLIYTML
jgi:hypothetical protein